MQRNTAWTAKTCVFASLVFICSSIPGVCQETEGEGDASASPSFKVISYSDIASKTNPYKVLSDAVEDDELSSGNSNGVVNPGETVSLAIGLQNATDRDYLSLSAFLEVPKSLVKHVKVLGDEIIFDEILAGKSLYAPKGESFRVVITDTLPAEVKVISFRLLLWDSEFGKEYVDLPLAVERVPNLDFGQVVFDDDRPGPSDGDGDGRPESGETIELRLRIRNAGDIAVEGAAGKAIRATLSVDEDTEKAGVISITEDVLEYGAIPAGAERPTPADYDFSIAAISGKRNAVFRLALENCQANGYAYRWEREYAQSLSGGPPEIATVVRRRYSDHGAYAATGKQLLGKIRMRVNGESVDSISQGGQLLFDLPAEADPTKSHAITAVNEDGEESAPLTIVPSQLPLRMPLDNDFDYGIGSWQATSKGSTLWHHYKNCLRATTPGINSYGANASTSVTSPVCDLRKLSLPILTFDHCFLGSDADDYMYVQVSTNGGEEWKMVLDSRSTEVQKDWQQAGIDLTPYRSELFQLRFSFVSDSSSSGGGYYLDTVRVVSRPPVVRAVYSPVGRSDVFAIRGDGIVKGTVVFVDGKPTTTQRDATETLFSVPASAGVTYSVAVQNPDGEISKAVDIDTTKLASPTLLESEFELALDDWWQVASSGATTWHHYPKHEAEGENCLRGAIPRAIRYASGGSTSSITSPVLDLRRLSLPVLTFQHAVSSDSAGYMIVYASRDGGEEWTMILDSRSTGVQSRWQREKIDLTPYRSELFQLRFTFLGPGRFTDSGYDLDAVRVASRPPVVHAVYRPVGRSGVFALRGDGVVEGAVVLVDGEPATTQRDDGETLFSVLSSAGVTYSVAVQNPDGETSEAIAIDTTKLASPTLLDSGFELALDDWWQVASNGSTIWHQYAKNAGEGEGCLRAAIPGTGSHGGRASTSITSPVLDLRKLSLPALTFQHAFGASPDYAFMAVHASRDGGEKWVMVLDSRRTGVNDKWQSEAVDLTPYRSELFQLRFTFTNQSSSTLSGSCYLDSVRVVSRPPVVRDVYPPVGRSGVLAIRGDGIMEGAVVLVDGKPATTQRDATETLFSTPKSVGSTYSVAVRNPDGETSEAIDVDTAKPASPSLLDSGFEIALDDWWQVASSGSTIWHQYAKNAAEGEGCLRAAIPGTGSYGDNASTSITSPVLDLRNLSSPTLTFRHIRVNGDIGDDLTLAVSVDGGNEWQDVYSSHGRNNTKWNQEDIDLRKFVSGQFQFRFTFISDSSGVGVGYLLDSVRVHSAATGEN